MIPKRIIAADPGETGFWHRWAGFVVRRPVPVLLVGLAIVVVLLIPAFQINPADAQAKDYPGKGDAFVGRDALTAAGHLGGRDQAVRRAGAERLARAAEDRRREARADRGHRRRRRAARLAAIHLALR